MFWLQSHSKAPGAIRRNRPSKFSAFWDFFKKRGRDARDRVERLAECIVEIVKLKLACELVILEVGLHLVADAAEAVPQGFLGQIWPMIGLAVGQIWPIRPLFSLVLYVILLEIVCWMDGNRHAADRLHELRAKIRTLEAEADELRLYLQQNLTI